MHDTGRQAGIIFSEKRRVVNTMNAHRLMEWCNTTQPELADSLMENLFSAYFEEGLDVSKFETLIEICRKVEGLDMEAAKTALETTELFSDEVIEKDNKAKRGLRVSGVPFFIIENQNGGRPITFSGAQVIFIKLGSVPF